MFIIKGLLDRILFAAGVLIFMQAPHFVDQYTQRLGGFYQAQAEHLRQYQNIANDQYGGDLEALIGEFDASGRESVKQTAGAIRENQNQVGKLKSDLDVLEHRPFFAKLVHLTSNMRYSIAKETARVFTPGMPFTLEALVCGLIGGILFSILFYGVAKFPKLFSRQNIQTGKPKPRRIEPSVMRSHPGAGKPASRLT